MGLVVFACRFVQDMELSAMSTDVGMKMNIWKAHRLLGHGNGESMQFTEKQLGWTITQGKLKPCLHCAKLKAKQENVSKEVSLRKP